jgi:predicted membrane-bound mannosyltransferase
MKATGIIVPVCVLIAVGLGVCVRLEHQACLKLDAQNDVLRHELNRMAELTAENERLSNLLAQTNATHPDGTAGTNAATDQRLEEMARLRKQVEAFRQQSNDVANLRADTRATGVALDEAAQAQRANRMASHHNSGDTNGAALAILEADYGTTQTNLDVTDAINDRIRGGNVKMIASNRLGGDPDFGQVKNLTVVYRFGGAVFTNQFREGDIVVLPPETPPNPP